MKKAIFLRTSDVIKPRVQKIMNVAKEVYDEVYYLGAIRGEKKDDYDDEKLKVRFIGVKYAYSKAIPYFFGTIVYILHSIVKIFKIKPDLLHCSDLETAISGYVYKIFNPKVLFLVNVHDNYFARHNYGKRIEHFLKWLEYKIYKRADLCLFPDQNRVKLYAPYTLTKNSIIPNVPDAPPYKEPPSIDGKIKLFVAGNISTVRGLDTLLALADNHDDIEIHIIGGSNEADMKKIKGNKKIIFYGHLPQEKTLAIGQECHIIPIFYNPNILIHVYSSPNKLYDAFGIGRPVVMNKGMMVSSMVDDYDMGKLIEYGDLEALEQGIRDLVSDFDKYKEQCNNLRTTYNNEFQWKTYHKIIKEMFLKHLDEVTT